MSNFQKITEILDRLLGPGGCPWDQEQTMKSIRSAPIEEGYELKEAIELGDNHHMQEELGDLFLTAIFLAKLAEKEKRFTMSEVFQELSDKLIRRHPHVFGEKKLTDSRDVKDQWEEIKKLEKGKEQRNSLLDGVPKGLPILHRAQKVLHKIGKTTYQHKGPYHDLHEQLENEEAFASALLELLYQAEKQDVDLEHVLRIKLSQLENDFRHFEMGKPTL